MADAETLTIDLRQPVEHDGATYGKLSLRPPTAREYLDMMKLTGMASANLAVSMIAGLPLAAVEKVGVRDINAAAKFLNRFLPVDPPADAPKPEWPEALTLSLRTPVEFAGETFRELQLREPMSGEYIEAEKLGGIEGDIHLVSITSGVPRSVIDRIDVRDLDKAAEFLGHFLT